MARDNPETNPIPIKPKTASHVAEHCSWVPLPSCSLPGRPFPIKSPALSACVSPRTIHFQVLDKSPLSGPGRGPLPYNRASPQEHSGSSSLALASSPLLPAGIRQVAPVGFLGFSPNLEQESPRRDPLFRSYSHALSPGTNFCTNNMPRISFPTYDGGVGCSTPFPLPFIHWAIHKYSLGTPRLIKTQSLSSKNKISYSSSPTLCWELTTCSWNS